MFPPRSPPPPPLPFLILLFALIPPPSLPSPSLSHSPLRWTSPHDPCYQLDGRPRHCLSEFINAAYGVPVRSGDPGGGPWRNVTALTDLHNPHNLSCWTPAGGPGGGDWALTVPLGRRFEVTYISLQFCPPAAPAAPFHISILKSMDHGASWRPLQFYSSECQARFGRPARTLAPTRHQETEPLCSDPRPLQRHRGGTVLAFSTLDGRPSSPDFDFSPVLQDWATATDIRVVFHQTRASAAAGPGQEARQGDEVGGALRWRAGAKGEGAAQVEREGRDPPWGFREKETRTKITDSTGRRKQGKTDKPLRRNGGGSSKSSGQEAGHNVTRKETDTRGSDSPSSRKGKGRGRKREGPRLRPCQDGVCDWTIDGQGWGSKGRELRRRRNHGGGVVSPRPRQRSRGGLALPASHSSLSAPPPSPPPLALSDLQVGGRCKCNGHASRCRRDAQGLALCQCEHHTAGPDCDVCEPFYYDRPWQRATPTQPHPCVPCECNGHSSKCRFSMEVFQQSGRHSGGVCLKCRHHTAGRHCQFCQSGYTRDHSKPLSHRKACQPCQCHPMGAVGRWCNQATGQCLCRDGVTGQRCNRCAPGYKQGRSPLRPCLRIQEVAPPTPVYQPQYSIGEACQSYCQPSLVKVKMNLETYCLKDYVLKVQVRAMERSGPWWQFSVWVQSVFRVGTPRVRRGPQALWVPDRDLGCGCPALQVGRTFLLIGAEEGGRSWAPEERRLVADRSTLALQWREHWSPKLRGFRGHDKRGRCPVDRPANSSARHTHVDAEYTPPHLEKLRSETHTPPHLEKLRSETHTPPHLEKLRSETHTQHTHSQPPALPRETGHSDGTHNSLGQHTPRITRTHNTHTRHTQAHLAQDGGHSAENGQSKVTQHTSSSPHDTQSSLQDTQNPLQDTQNPLQHTQNPLFLGTPHNPPPPEEQLHPSSTATQTPEPPV